MTILLPLLALASLAVGILLGRFARRRRVTSQGAHALAALDQLSASLVSLERNLTEQREETGRARDEAARQQRRADEYFAKIDGCVAEAMNAKSLYVRMGAEHGNAQGMMLTEIESLARQYQSLAVDYRNATGRAPRRPQPLMNQSLARIAAEFTDEHITPYAPPAPPAPGGPPVSVSSQT